MNNLMTCPKMTKGTTWEYDNHWEIIGKHKKMRTSCEHCGNNMKMQGEFIMNVIGTS